MKRMPMELPPEDQTAKPALVEGGQSSRKSPTSQQEKHEKLEKLLRVMKALVENQFTGYLKLNFTQGTLARVEKFEEILRK
ncbi:MAG: hypothetical protein AB9873_12680 [Syntrophobacteraceae bacterium]